MDIHSSSYTSYRPALLALLVVTVPVSAAVEIGVDTHYEFLVQDFDGNVTRYNPTAGQEIVDDRANSTSRTLFVAPDDLENPVGPVGFTARAEVTDYLWPQFKVEASAHMQAAPQTDQGPWRYAGFKGFALAWIDDEIVLQSPGRSGRHSFDVDFHIDGSQYLESGILEGRDSPFHRVHHVSSLYQVHMESTAGGFTAVDRHRYFGSYTAPPEIQEDETFAPIDPFYGVFTTTGGDSTTQSIDVDETRAAVCILGEPCNVKITVGAFVDLSVENVDVADAFNVAASTLFGNTVRLTGARLVDAGGTPLPFTVESALDIDYKGLSQPVPLPTTLALLAPAIIGLGFARRAVRPGDL